MPETNHTLRTTVPESVFDAMSAAAAAEGVTLSAYTRRVLSAHDHSSGSGATPSTVTRADMGDLMRRIEELEAARVNHAKAIRALRRTLDVSRNATDAAIASAGRDH